MSAGLALHNRADGVHTRSGALRSGQFDGSLRLDDKLVRCCGMLGFTSFKLRLINQEWKMSLETLTALFGWMTVINFGFLAFSGFFLIGLKSQIVGLHHWLTGLDEKDLNRAYFRYLSKFKVLAIVTSFAPYLALKLI